jgi:hypothetical protein
VSGPPAEHIGASQTGVRKLYFWTEAESWFRADLADLSLAV